LPEEHFLKKRAAPPRCAQWRPPANATAGASLGNRKEERFSSQYMKAKFANQMKHGEEMAI